VSAVLDAPQLLADLIARARRAGADAADAMLVESAGLSATRRLGKLEKIERAEGCDLGLRVFVGRRQALVATGDLSGASLERLVESALAIARAVPEDRYAGLAEPEQIARKLPELDLDDGEEPGAEALVALAESGPTALGRTAYGIIGVKVWIFKGEIMEHDPMAQENKALEAQEGGRSTGRREPAPAQG